MKKDELIAQKDAIKNCGYQIARERLHKLVEIEELRIQKLVIEKIISYWELKGDAIRRAVKVGFPENTEAITALEEKIGKLNAFTLSKDTVLQEGEAVIALGNGEYTILDFNEDRRKIQEKEQNVENVIKEIELLSKNNKMLKLLSSLIANKQEMIRYRNTVLEQNGNARCPVCGSESFATMEETSILKEADEYVKQNGITVKKKEVENSLLQKDIEVLYQKIISCLKDIVKNEKEKLTSKISNLKVLKNETQSYFDEVKKIELIREEINSKELTEEKARELLAHIGRELLEKPDEHEARDTYQQILTVLGYEFYNETVHQTYEKVKRLATKTYEISNFSYDLFVSKINSIDSILSNKELSDLKARKEEATKKNEVLDKEIAELQQLKETASQRSKDIKVIVEELSKDEYKKVGPALAKFYNKLARFNAGNGINILQENEGISLVDNKGKNIVNVLSNGQISVFMLAHFFAGINSRNDREKFRIYFIDDLTACMDDVNILAFMDLLKYQISTKSTMDQLFFSTCDDRISKLLKYKLDGRGIELCELSELDFV